MPVIDLRGLVPQAPPEQPAFERTRKLARGSPYEQALAFEQQAADIRANRGMAALQAMQNQQDKIAQEAQNLRLQQEAQMAAQEATKGLSGLDPTMPDYLGQRQQILQKTPSALLDPQFRNALGVYDQGYEENARQQLAAQKPFIEQQRRAKELATRAVADYGIDPNELAPLVNEGNVMGVAQRMGQAKASMTGTSRSTRDPAQQAYKELYEISQKDVEDLAGLETLTPEEKARVEEAALHRKNYFNYLKGLTPDGKPVAPVPSGVTASPAPTATTVPTGAPTPSPSPAPTPSSAPTMPGNLEAELSRIPVTEQAAWLEKRKEQEVEKQKVIEEWTKAKAGIEKQLIEKFPDKPYPGTNIKPLEQLAMQIKNGQLVYDTDGIPNPETGELPKIPLAEKILRDLKIAGYGEEKAFTEPGSGRKRFFGLLGNQDVTYSELIRDWADKFLKNRNLIPKTLEEESELKPGDPEKIGKVMKDIVAASEK